jgi:uncharacterized protein
MIVVIDTNVLVKMAAGGTREPLFVAWRNRQFDLCLSLPVFQELEDVLSRPKMQRFVQPAAASRFLTELLHKAIFVDPAAEHPHCRDPKDDVVIATAVSAKADFLITIDKDLYDDLDFVAAMNRSGIQVVLPPVFLKSLRHE